MILAINGSYREGGFSDRALNAFSSELDALGETLQVVHLRDYPIEFCLNCRECTLHAGEKPAKCIQKDSFNALVDEIEQARGFILASPTNIGGVTALFKRFMERLIVYAYWPWEAPAPTARNPKVGKSAILVTSSAAPALMARLSFSTVSELKKTADIIGAKPIGVIANGFAAKPTQANKATEANTHILSEKVLKKIKHKAKVLATQG